MSTENTIKGRGLLSGVTTDRPALAAALLVASLFMLSLQDGLVKLVSGDVSLWQFQLLRAAINLALLLLLTRAIWGRASPRPKRLWAVALRSAFLVTFVVFLFGGVPFLSLAEIAAGLYVFPLFVAVLSALLLGERVGPRRVIMILIGFGGTLLILKPGTDAFKPVGLMPICAGLCYAGVVLTTRRLCREESAVTLAFGVAVALLTVGAAGLAVFSILDPGPWAADWPYLFTAWHPLDLAVVGLIAAASCLNLTATVTLARAYQSAESSWLVPFDYSYLIFATFWGLVLWGHIPDGLTFLGMAMIAGAGVFVAWRERQESRQRGTREIETLR